MTGYKGMGFELGGLLLWCFADWNVLVDRPYMFSCSTVWLALGLYDVAAGLSSLVDNGP